MIRLPAILFPGDARKALRTYQQEVDAVPAYADRVEAADRLFHRRNKSSNPVFRAVRATLSKMCAGARRCCYCEDSLADEVEHIRPKNLYPGSAFRWSNYLYACGPCNGPKNNQYAVLSCKTNKLIDVTRRSKDPVRPPKAGIQALIDPRRENPQEFMELDLIDTFFFVPTADDGTQEYLRAEYTIGVLRLNRDLLPVARKNAFGSYKARLHEYMVKKTDGTDEKVLTILARGIRTLEHPSVWVEMKRQRVLHPELTKLFADTPEALDW